MQRLLFLSITSGLVAASGCSDDSCGPMGAPDVGILASSADVVMTYGNFTAGPHHDCPDTSSDVESLTFGGVQKDIGALITFCVPRPDMLRAGVPIGTGLRIIDFNGEANGCGYCLTPGSVPDGTAQAEGICDNGTNSAGFSLTLNGHIVLSEVCPASPTCPSSSGRQVPVQLSGTVAVKAVP